jgi:hypothetical protein
MLSQRAIAILLGATPSLVCGCHGGVPEGATEAGALDASAAPVAVDVRDAGALPGQHHRAPPLARRVSVVTWSGVSPSRKDVEATLERDLYGLDVACNVALRETAESTATANIEISPGRYGAPGIVETDGGWVPDRDLGFWFRVLEMGEIVQSTAAGGDAGTWATADGGIPVLRIAVTCQRTPLAPMMQ